MRLVKKKKKERKGEKANGIKLLNEHSRGRIRDEQVSESN